MPDKKEDTGQPKPRVSAVQLANTFIERFGQDKDIDHLKLQKLCYYAYGWWLAFKTTPLTTSGPQVWKLGPVFRPIYASFASYRDRPIKSIKSSSPFEPALVIEKDCSSSESQLVDWIWDRYGDFSGVELSNKTHEIGTPWYEVAKERNFEIPKFTSLPDDKIRSYFNRLAIEEGSGNMEA